jgi:hypothetical protein
MAAGAAVGVDGRVAVGAAVLVTVTDAGVAVAAVEVVIVANGVANGEWIAVGSLDGVASAHAFNSAMAKASRPIVNLYECIKSSLLNVQDHPCGLVLKA